VERACHSCLIVGLEDERFGIDTTRIRSVAEYRTPAPIPGRPRLFLGALNHHGELLPVAALAALLGRRLRLDPPRSAIVILDWEDGLLGLLVERTYGLLTSPDGIRLSHVLGCWQGPHVSQTLEADGRNIHVLDVDSLLAALAGSLG
jgi:chemotaxis signal transduction protein